MTFEQALEYVKEQGKGMRLPQWDKKSVIRIKTEPRLYNGRVPWKENMTELFSDEWEVVE